jgi:hypothetical protein
MSLWWFKPEQGKPNNEVDLGVIFIIYGGMKVVCSISIINHCVVAEGSAPGPKPLVL